MATREVRSDTVQEDDRAECLMMGRRAGFILQETIQKRREVAGVEVSGMETLVKVHESPHPST
jgi:hypothetical protein